MAPFSNGFPAFASGRSSSDGSSKAEPPASTKSQGGLLPTISDTATPGDAGLSSLESYTAGSMMTRSNSSNMLARSSSGIGTTSYMRGVMHQQAATRVCWAGQAVGGSKRCQGGRVRAGACAHTSGQQQAHVPWGPVLPLLHTVATCARCPVPRAVACCGVLCPPGGVSVVSSNSTSRCQRGITAGSSCRSRSRCSCHPGSYTHMTSCE